MKALLLLILFIAAVLALAFLLGSANKVLRRFSGIFSLIERDILANQWRVTPVYSRGGYLASYGAALIVQERQRQRVKDYSGAHDDAHVNGELRRAAFAYTLPWSPAAEEYWPFEHEEYTPTGAATGVDAIRDLTRAGALIAAEIDRLQRIEDRKKERGNL